MIAGGGNTDHQGGRKVETEGSQNRDEKGEERQIEEVRTAHSEKTENQLDIEEELSRLREDLTQARESADNNLNKLRYMMADFDNYRKQMEKQLYSKIEASKAEILLKFLNIRDDFLRALEMVRQNKSDTVIVEGLQGILKNFDNLLSSEGVI
ncbi:MAG: nucleotide exchange factor GrpE, partial [Thermoproteota archaeon]|nr:nucleotide exchange factor GrpE [Thermoproteota archaeon]